MEIEYTCPLGSTCEEAKDGKIFRCRWFINVKGKHPQSDETIDQFDCALAWQPLLTIENTRQVMGSGAAIESFRNEMVKVNSIPIKFDHSEFIKLQLQDKEI